jgi:hypothetical protein
LSESEFFFRCENLNTWITVCQTKNLGTREARIGSRSYVMPSNRSTTTPLCKKRMFRVDFCEGPSGAAGVVIEFNLVLRDPGTKLT